MVDSVQVPGILAAATPLPICQPIRGPPGSAWVSTLPEHTDRVIGRSGEMGGALRATEIFFSCFNRHVHHPLGIKVCFLFTHISSPLWSYEGLNAIGVCPKKRQKNKKSNNPKYKPKPTEETDEPPPPP